MIGLPVVDPAVALEQAGGNEELAGDLFGMLLEELPVHERVFRECLAAGDFERMRVQAHKLKGSTAYCGVPALRAVVADFEGRLRQGQRDGICELLEAVIRETRRIVAAGDWRGDKG